MRNQTWRRSLKSLASVFSSGDGSPRSKRLRGSHRPLLERLEDRTVPTITIANGGGQGFLGLDFNQSGGYVPPDTCGAVGPTNYVETVNQTLAIYSPKSSGTTHVSDSFSHFLFTTGGLTRTDSGSGLSDPIVAFNDQIGRFIVGDQDVNFNTHVSSFDIAVSKSSSPTTLTTADWTFYKITTTESGFDADFPGNFGYNHDAFVFTLNMFGVLGGGHVQVVSIKNSDLAGGAALTSGSNLFRNDLNDFSVRAATEHNAVAGDPEWLVTDTGDGAHVTVYKMTNVLSSAPSFTRTDLAVTPYLTALNNPLNPNGTVITNNIDSRIQKASLQGTTLVATHAVAVSSTEDDAQWYRIDVSSGTPVLADQGRVSAGNHTYVYYPTIDINSSGQIGMTYMKSGTDSSTDYMSMYVTGRLPTDAAGTMETSVLVPSGAGQANYKDFTTGGRAGDLSGINVDPSDGSFWAANEFANTEATANWGTAIASFTVSTPFPPTDMAVTATGPSSVTAGTNATYIITITNNGPNAAQGVILTDTLPAGSNFVSMTQTSGTDGFTLSQSGGTATETATGSIAAGATDTFTLVVFAPASLANGAAFNDTATVSATNSDPNTSNNTATVTGTIVNNNPNSDVVVALSGPATANEGDSVTYNITVTNNGPASATGVSLTDTLASILNFQSATSSQGTFSQSGGVVTFTIGSIASGGTVSASVTAQAIEDGSTTNTAAAASTSPDPNTANNTASVNTSFAEPTISVSGPVHVKGAITLTNFKTATFTHATAVEPVSAFVATINWGDGSSSSGTITLSGTTYTVTGSHTYTVGGRHTITTSVVESGSSPNGGDKFGDDHPGGDIVHYSPPSDGGDQGDDAPGGGFLQFVFGNGGHGSGGPTVQPPNNAHNGTPDTDIPLVLVQLNLLNQHQGTTNTAGGATAGTQNHFNNPPVAPWFFQVAAQARLPMDWLADFWFGL